MAKKDMSLPSPEARTQAGLKPGSKLVSERGNHMSVKTPPFAASSKPPVFKGGKKGK